MSFLQSFVLLAMPLVALPILIHLINQWRYQTKQWGAMKFLLAANKMNRGFAKIRQWLILAMRTLAVAALIFAVARPLASGLMGLTGGGKTDTTIVILDRSPSMQQQGLGGLSKIETAKRQIGDALTKLGSNHWIAIDSCSAQAQEYETVEAMVDSSSFTSSSASADLPVLMQSALDYLKTNNPGPSEVWICSDLRESDWNSDSGTWNVIREGFLSLPQSVRFNMLAYPNSPQGNLAVRVKDVKRVSENVNGIVENAVLLSMQFSRTGQVADDEKTELTVQIEIEGARSELTVEMTGSSTEIRNHRVALANDQETGWGKVILPADANNADNTYYFVFAEAEARRIVVVSEDRSDTRAIEIAAGIAPSGETNSVVEVISPDQLDSLVLDDTALLLWQTNLPDSSTAPAVQNYVDGGGQVMFFPPTSLTTAAVSTAPGSYMGVSWDMWQQDSKVMVENWRGDQDLLAATNSGMGLPVGQIELGGYAKLRSEVELSKLAMLTGGEPLIAKLPTTKGGVYFFTASTNPKSSTLAESGIVLFVAIQRAIEQGQLALGNTTARTAEFSEEPTGEWRKLTGSDGVLSTEFPVHGGVYQFGDRLFAIN
ncbi:MAG: BatA domain-containing protein, partial [Planctomycetota bacterium]